MAGGRPPGSTSKPYRDALRQVLADAENTPAYEHRRLRRIAERHIELAARGDLPAIQSLADRLDGKAVQGHGQDSELGPLMVRWLSQPESEEVPLDTSSTQHGRDTQDKPETLQ